MPSSSYDDIASSSTTPMSFHDFRRPNRRDVQSASWHCFGAGMEHHDVFDGAYIKRPDWVIVVRYPIKPEDVLSSGAHIQLWREVLSLIKQVVFAPEGMVNDQGHVEAMRVESMSIASNAIVGAYGTGPAPEQSQAWQQRSNR
jgi:hypothetical protein